MALFDIFKKNKNDLLGSKGPITSETVSKAMTKLQEYRNGKQVLEDKTVDNEDFWKKRQYETYTRPDEQFIPASAWLWNCIVNKHSQLVAAYPAFNIIPRQADDEDEAAILSTILPVVLRQAGYKKVYSQTSRYKVIQGTGITGVFWDAAACNGLGEIVIKKCDLLNLFWEPGVTDIQDSPNFFSISLVDTDVLDQSYPEHTGEFGKTASGFAQYNYDDNVDTSKKSVVVEWYYKKNVDGKNTVQYCKFVNNVVLYATENETAPVTDANGNVIRAPLSQTGLYADGKYPFVFDALFSIEGTPAGYGYTDIGKDAQIQIDMLNNAITRNAMLACKPRWLARRDTAVNMGEFLDWEKDVISVAGDLSEAAIRQVDVNQLGGIYLEVLNSRINELKETLGNRDVNTGGTVSGVTTASGIAALQEAGGRIDKAAALETYNAQEEIALMVISRIKQFYTTPRCFRILDETGKARYEHYQSKVDASGFPELPYFDIDITAEKAAPYKAISQNELMLQFYGQRFFDPSNAQQALACLQGMDFDGKEKIIQVVQSNNSLMQQMVKLASLVDNAYGTQITQQLGIGAPATVALPEKKISGEEPAHMQKARTKAQEASQPI